jgi:hypothetical protein
MTRLYTMLALIGTAILAYLGIRRGAMKEAERTIKADAAIAGAEVKERIADATIKQAGDSDDAIRERLRKRPANKP